MDISTIFLLMIGALLAVVVISLLAKKHVHVATSLSPERAAEVLDRKFSGFAWKRVEGLGSLNYRARLGSIGRRPPPVMSIDIGTDPDTGLTHVEFWMSEWTSQWGMVNHIEKVFWKRWSIPKALRDAESAAAPAASSGLARSEFTELGHRNDARATPGFQPPQLERIEFVYTESRRYEDQSAFRFDRPPASIWSIPQAVGVLGSSGQPLLPWDARNVSEAVVSPSGRAIAFLTQALDPLQIQTAEGTSLAVASMPAFRIMQNKGFSTCGMSWSPDGRQIACMEWNGVGTLTLLDSDTGTRTFLTTLQGVAGYEVPLFSTDGQWILVPTSSAPQLISLEESIVVQLPLKSAYVDWWPSEGPSTLFALTGAPGEQHCALYDLATATLDDLGPVILPVQDDLPKDRQIVFGPRMSPDGRRVLLGAFFGPDARYQEEQGSRNRVAVLDVSTRTVSMQTEPFVDPGLWLERVHERWSWVAKPRTSAPVSGPTEVAAELRVSARPFETIDPANDEPPTERIVIWDWTNSASASPSVPGAATVAAISALSSPSPADRGATLSRSSSIIGGSHKKRLLIGASAGIVVAITAWLMGNSKSKPTYTAVEDPPASAQQEGLQGRQGPTFDPTPAGEPVESESSSLTKLRQLAGEDRSFVETQLADKWVPQISSKRPGIVDDGVLWNNARTLKEFVDNREKYDAKLLWSGDWSTFSAPDFWVTVVPVTFADSDGALQWCTSHGFDSWHCLAKLVSSTHPVSGSTALNGG